MLLFKKLFRMQRNTKTSVLNYITNAPQEHESEDYESAIRALNGLQSNAQYINLSENETSHNAIFSKTILQIQKYLNRSGISLETLDTLPVIHVAGTKGKGTTCAICESILRHHGLKTGFYSSPHLFEVRERIRINGNPIGKQEFTQHFWNLYKLLDEQKSDADDMPMYFKFLTLMAFRVFLFEKVDVAIIEVGIGGEYDSTNILRKVPVVGITSLGLDHTNMLGDTLEKIAWQKAGIMKPNSQVFTVPQPPEAMKVLKSRSLERKCNLKVVDPNSIIPIPNSKCEPMEIFRLNANLAVALSDTWMKLYKKKLYKNILSSEATKLGILKYNWPGRYQILHLSNNYYLDGAHTLESITICTDWFKKETKLSRLKRVLIFNATGDRNSEDFIEVLKLCNFEKVFFVPNKATSIDSEDTKNFTIANCQQLARCHAHRNIWLKNTIINQINKVQVLPSVLDALKKCNSSTHNVLITGSLYLVGAALSILDPV